MRLPGTACRLPETSSARRPNPSVPILRTVPGWQLSTAYISRLKKGEEIMQIGLLYFVIEDGKVEHHWIVDTRDVTERVKA